MPLERSGQDLWDAALAKARKQGIDLLNPWHVMQAAWESGVRLSANKLVKRAINETQWQKLKDDATSASDMIEALINFNKDDLAQEASRLGWKSNDSFVLWSALTKTSFDGFMQFSGIPREKIDKLIEELKSVCQAVSGSDQRVEVAFAEAQDWVNELQPTDGHSNKDLAWPYLRTLDFFLALAGNTTSVTPQIVILTGPHGSPIEHMVDVLVDWLDLKDNAPLPLQGDLASLRDKKVYNLDLLALLSLRNSRGSPQPGEILAQAISTHRAGHILMLDHINVLAGRGPVITALRTAINRTARGLVFGRFIYEGEQISSGENEIDKVTEFIGRFELANAAPFLVAPLNDQETQDFLKHHYEEDWAKQGYRFDDDAFDYLFKLKAGGKILNQYTTCPYLAVRVAKALIVAARVGGSNSIKGRIKQALEALGKLRREDKKDSLTPDEEDVLANAKKELEEELARLEDSPELLRKDNLIRLTRAHVTAQLLGGAGYGFDPSPPPELTPPKNSRR